MLACLVLHMMTKLDALPVEGRRAPMHSISHTKMQNSVSFPMANASDHPLSNRTDRQEGIPIIARLINLAAP
jgi:hypothetical protein